VAATARSCERRGSSRMLSQDRTPRQPRSPVPRDVDYDPARDLARSLCRRGGTLDDSRQAAALLGKMTGTKRLRSRRANPNPCGADPLRVLLVCQPLHSRGHVHQVIAGRPDGTSCASLKQSCASCRYWSALLAIAWRTRKIAFRFRNSFSRRGVGVWDTTHHGRVPLT
jgi:hypothetical protein